MGGVNLEFGGTTTALATCKIAIWSAAAATSTVPSDFISLMKEVGEKVSPPEPCPRCK